MNLLSELRRGEDDQVEDEVRSKGDGGEADVHISCRSGLCVVIPATLSWN